MYWTQVGNTQRGPFNRTTAYRKAWEACLRGYHHVLILFSGELEATLITYENGQVDLRTPKLADKWEANQFMGEVVAV